MARVQHVEQIGELAGKARLSGAEMVEDDDPELVENFNTLMDDNKRLCLANGEIIKLTPDVRIIFEPITLANETPAFVSRLGQVTMDLERSFNHPTIEKWM